MRDLYQEVTNRIVADLEQGVKPWERPWRTNGHSVPSLPQNMATGRSYQGVNTLVLWSEAMTRGYPSHAWATYKQVADMGGHVRKGEKASPVIYVGMKEVEEKGKKVYRPFARWFMVFNAAQVDGISLEPVDQRACSNADVQRIVDHSRVNVRHGYDRAYYKWDVDTVFMPYVAQFKDEPAYIRTLLHELVHATGHDTRLAREFGKRFGDSEYAMEELVAELGSAFLCARLGTPYANENAEYIGAWVRQIKADSRAIFTAAAAAARASDWLHPSYEDE